MELLEGLFGPVASGGTAGLPSRGTGKLGVWGSGKLLGGCSARWRDLGRLQDESQKDLTEKEEGGGD